jgi:DNA topoisomerase-1
LNHPNRPDADAKAAARSAGLHYMPDDRPGITRKRQGHGFSYIGTGGKAVRDKRTLARIAKLAIPPAWTKVWISPDADGHLAATGRDQKGRKQYRYNPDFIRVRDAAKFEHVAAFAKQLPQIRKHVAGAMAQGSLSRERVLATVVYLLERTLCRIGNEEYARDNKSYGLTTLRNRHVSIKGAELKFRFKGKSDKAWQFTVDSKRVASVIRACQEISGQHLFEYRDESGAAHNVNSSDVNAYLREITGGDITAKDFRTWAGTVIAATRLRDVGDPGEPSLKAHVKDALGAAAARLGNTIAICRKCYVHPAVLESYEAGVTIPHAKSGAAKRFALTGDERAVLRLLEHPKRRSKRAA